MCKCLVRKGIELDKADSNNDGPGIVYIGLVVSTRPHYDVREDPSWLRGLEFIGILELLFCPCSLVVG